MERSKIFEILGIDETKEKDVIKNAYRNQLVYVNPEDNEEAFRELRQAYEEATKLCDISEEKDEIDTTTPMGRLIAKVSETYRSLPKRIRIDSWVELLSDELFVEFDTFNEARIKLLEFFMNHFRLPHKIYQYINEELNILDDYEELSENFPKNFLDFIAYQINNQEFMDLFLFQGEEFADYDEYINEYFEIKNKIDSNQISDSRELFDNIERYGIYHPYLDVERIRIFLLNHEAPDKTIVSRLCENYKDNLYVRYYLMLIKWNEGKYEEAYQDITYLLKESPNHYFARKKLAEYYMQIGEYKDSKEECFTLLELDPYDEAILDLMRKDNDFLIEKLTKNEELTKNKELTKNEELTNNEEFSNRMELAWCYYQNERYQECLFVLDAISPKEEDMLDYNNLKGRNYVSMNRYEEAIPHLLIWESELDKLDAMSSQEAYKKKRRYILARYLRALCYQELASVKENKEEYLKKALEILDFDIDAWDDRNTKLASHNIKAKILLDLYENEKCIDECEHILTLDLRYFPAYVYLMEAYYHLRDGQQVINLFYKAIELYTAYAKPYVLAIKVFFYHGQYEDAKRIINMAKENQVTSNELEFYEVKNKRFLAKKIDEVKELFPVLDKIISKLSEEENDIECISDVYMEKVYAYMDIRDYEIALTEILSVIEKFPEENRAYRSKGKILYRLKKYKEAIELFETYRYEEEQDEELLCNLGDCYDELKEYEKALLSYKRVLELDKNHYNANNKIMNLYISMYDNKWNREHFLLAIEYGTRQLDIKQSSYYYIERGMVYFDGYMFEEARADFQRAIDVNAESAGAYNNLGRIYRAENKNKEALQMFLKAVELDEEFVAAHRNLASIYLILHEYDKAYEVYNKCSELFPNSKWYEKKASALRRAGRFEEAILVYLDALAVEDKEIEITHDTEAEKKREIVEDIYDSLATTYKEQDDKEKAKACYDTMILRNPNSKLAYSGYGYYYLYVEADFLKSLEYFLKSFEIYKKEEIFDIEYADICIMIEMVYYFLGKTAMSQKYFEIALETYKKIYGSIELYLDNTRYKLARCFFIFEMYFFAGHIEEAKKYSDMMQCNYKCAHCNFGICFEAHMTRGYLLAEQGDKKNAIIEFEIALKEDIYDLKNKFMLNWLKSK